MQTKDVFSNAGLFLLGVALQLPVTSHAQSVILPANPTPNQASLAAHLQNVCTQLAAAADSVGGLTAPQRDLLSGCQLFQDPQTPGATLAAAYTAVLGQQINALGPQTKKFGSLQQDNLAARLAELRRGVRGSKTAGLVLRGDDGPISASSGNLGDYLPGGGSGDGNVQFLDGRLGVFINGSVKVGSKRKTNNSDAFDINDDTLTIGADYRVGERFVFGAAFGSGKLKTDFGSALGRLDLKSKGFSVYASFYGESYYVDVLAGYGKPTLETSRHIGFSGLPGGGSVDQWAIGSTHTKDLWTGISVGNSFHWRAWTATPEASINFHEIQLDGFSESMSAPGAPGAGFALTYNDAVVPSLQMRAGIRISYTWTTPFGVIEPNFHGSYIRERRDRSDAFYGHLSNAPAGLSGPGSSLVLNTDSPEGHYFANGGGMNFQFTHGISGFVDYEQLKTLKSIKSHEFSFGVRYQFGS